MPIVGDIKYLATIMTQNNELILLLKTRGSLGVNSFEPFRNNHRQLPRMVNDLRKLGHNIVSLSNKNTSVTYVLMSPIVKQSEVSHNFNVQDYVQVGNTFVHKSKLVPVQGRMSL